MTKITHITAREVFDSRGRPTVEVEIRCERGRPGRVIVPSGASTGQFEAHELRDGDPQRLNGLGVRRAVSHVTGEIAEALRGRDAAQQQNIDRLLCELDGTENKSRLGANALLGVSLACAYAAADARGLSPVEYLHGLWQNFSRETGAALPTSAADQTRSEETRNGSRTALLGREPLLPLPMVNMISGGLHAGGNLDLQDVLIIPVGAKSFRQALEWAVTIYGKLGELLSAAGYEGRLVGDEGGFGPKLQSNREALQFVVRAIEAARRKPGEEVALALDVAATHFFNPSTQHYHFATQQGKALSGEAMIDRLDQWSREFPLISIEDGLAEDDWSGWKQLTDRLGDRVQLIGDDLFVTNVRRLERGLAEGVANAVLIKVNQIGTLSETLQTLRRAVQAGYWPVISARSGETEDVTLADLAVATGAGQIKIGSVVRSERLAKYNQLLRLEEQYGGSFPGGRLFSALRS